MFRVEVDDDTSVVKVFAKVSRWDREFRANPSYEFKVNRAFVSASIPHGSRDSRAVLAIVDSTPQHAYYICDDVYEFDLMPDDRFVMFDVATCFDGVARARIEGARNTYALDEQVYIPHYLRGSYDREDRKYDVYEIGRASCRERV